MIKASQLVGVIDASSGVEAQTKTVWRQANNFHLPRIIYLNKMDKRGADVDGSLESIRTQLGVSPLLVHCAIGLERDFEGNTD